MSNDDNDEAMDAIITSTVRKYMPRRRTWITVFLLIFTVPSLLGMVYWHFAPLPLGIKPGDASSFRIGLGIIYGLPISSAGLIMYFVWIARCAYKAYRATKAEIHAATLRSLAAVNQQGPAMGQRDN